MLHCVFVCAFLPVLPGPPCVVTHVYHAALAFILHIALCTPCKLPEIPRLLVLEFRAVVPRVPRAYSALFRGDGNSAFGRSGCADHARNSRIYCADREIAQLLIIGYKYKMCSGYVSAHSSKVR